MARSLFLWSFLALFAELVVIRWLSSEVRVFAYLKNLPLLAAFLGLGLGMARGGEGPTRLPGFAPAAALLFVLIAAAEPLGLVHLNLPDSLAFMWQATDPVRTVDQLFSLGLILSFIVLVVLVFLPLGMRIGEGIEKLPPLRGYSINVAGSLAGIVVHAGMSWLGCGPISWVAVCFVVHAALSRSIRDLVIMGGAVLMITLAPQADRWSPYNRLDIDEMLAGPAEVRAGYWINANHDYHQRALDLSPAFLQAHPEVLKDPVIALAPYAYEMPYRLAAGLDSVLIVGTGTGNDVAAALRRGAAHVDAVEIDPTILELGRAHHPEKPYDSAKVRIINDDARSVFRRCRERYDLIVFALLDSHTMFSSLSSLRLESYVYTVESLREALQLLKPGGALALSFCVPGQDWLALRLRNILKEAAGSEPLVMHLGYDVAVLFMVGAGVEQRAGGKGALYEPARDGTHPQASIRPATDDWPFLYLSPHSGSSLYLGLFLVMIAGGWLAIRRTLGTGGNGVDLRMFLLGAGFMLVEVRGIAELSLLFGSTWLVNAAVFSGILGMVLLANLHLATRPPRSLTPAFVGLIAGLLLPWIFPVSRMAGWTLGLKAAAGVLWMSIPVYFSGVIFGTLFVRSPSPRVALASNIFGSLVGGLLEYTSMYGGISSLTLLALALYGAAWKKT